ncbi:MAG: hypothetical protein IIW17_04925 [Clostridia bacterium]|nr:hypothetical protein [Clostridia bacterium]
MKLRNVLIALLCVCMLLPLAACKPNPQLPEDTTAAPETTIPEEITTAPGEDQPQPPEPPQDAIEAQKQQLEAIKGNIGATTDTVLYLKDFGAVGDGKTNDGDAIFAALSAAAEQHATLKFEENKTYYVSSVTGSRIAPLMLNNAHGLTIDGCGSTILITPNMRYLRFNDCGNVKLTNLHFDYAVPVYLVGKVVEVNGNDVTYSLDQNPYADHYNFNGGGFSIMYNEGTQARPHMFMGTCVKTGDKQIKVTYTSAHHYKKDDVVFVPNPGVGHAADQVLDVRGSDQPMLFENIGVHAASTFVWALMHNDAHMFFENVDLVPSPTNEREIKMVAWRDGYHCKNNSEGIHWNNCEAEVLFDDVFNIAATLGVVSEVISNSSFSIKNYENPADVFICSPGDTVDIYDLKSGAYKGNARVRAVTNNADGSRTIHLYYGETIDRVSEGCVVANRDTGAPGSTITNCHFQGTFRFLRNLYVENTVFDLLVIWMMVEGSVEGPMPGNVDYVGCTFNGGDIQIDAYNRNAGKRMKDIGKEIKDIGFWGCTFKSCGIRSQTDCTYTEQDTFVTDDLYTVKNRANASEPQRISPTKSDIDVGVTWDWTLFTMPLTGTAAITPVSSMQDQALIDKLTVEGVGDNVLTLTAAQGEKLYLDGLSASSLKCLYEKGTSYIIKITYYTASAVKAKLLIGESVVCEDLFSTVGQITTVSLKFDAPGEGRTAYIEYEGAGTVYLGELTVAAFVNANPSNSQLENGHTFLWDKKVTIKGGTVLQAADVQNAAAKQAIAENPDKFGETVLHLNGDLGEFTGISKRAYFTAGTTYHISIDAYIASPISSGSTIYLLAMDNTPGNRVLKEGMFVGEGMYHFEMDWQIGNTGEYQLKFFINNTPAQYADIYVGNFTMTKMPGMAPNKTIVPDEIKQASAAELKAGFTYDFSQGIFLETSKNTYVDSSCLNDFAKEKLDAAGFGEYAYYYTENFDAIGLSPVGVGGKKVTITFEVYDCKGNLDDKEPDGSWRGAFVLLNMQGGVQNSAEVHYTYKADPGVPGRYTLTFTEYTPGGTDTLLFYQVQPCEFYISSITVQLG